MQIRVEGNNLVHQIRSAIFAAIALNAEFIVYTEPDKETFFTRGIYDLVSAAIRLDTPVLLAARDRESMRTFPDGQRRLETSFNQLAGEFLGTTGDLLYGPIAFRTDVLRVYMDDVAYDLGWGWRPFILARCVRDGLPVRLFEGCFECPEDQRCEDEFHHRAHRLKQLADNVRGLHNGLTYRK
jgi:hypothetical protein